MASEPMAGEQEIKDLSLKIEAVEKEIFDAAQKVLSGGNLQQYWIEKERQLREEKKLLLEEKRELREKEKLQLEEKRQLREEALAKGTEEKRQLREKEKLLLEEKRELLEEKRQLREKEKLLLEETRQLREEALAKVPSHDPIVLDLLQKFWADCRRRKPEQVVNYIPVKQWIPLAKNEGVLVPRRKGLYVRSDFKKFLEVCLESFRGGADFVHVSGPSGIGKSAFLWYVVMMAGAVTGNPTALKEFPGLSRLEGVDVFVQLSSQKPWLGFYRDGSVVRADLDTLRARCPDRKILCLLDQRYWGDQVGEVMVFASPDEENVKGIDRAGGPKVVTKIFPTWRTHADGFYELMKKELDLDRAAVDEVVERWGYVPRVLFKGDGRETHEAKLRDVIEKVTLSRISLFVGQRINLGHAEVPNRLFEMVPDVEKYEKYEVRFSSDWLAEMYIEHYWKKEMEKVAIFAQATEAQAMFASVRGRTYEYGVVHCWAEKRTTICATHIGDPKPPYPKLLKLNIQKKGVKRYKHLADIRTARDKGVDLTQYIWFPHQCNPLVDFLLFKPNIMGQATVSEKHSVLEEKLVETAAFIWEMTGFEEPTSYVIVTPSRSEAWGASSLIWKGVKGQERTKHEPLLDHIGKYVVEYHLPIGPQAQTAVVDEVGAVEGFKLGKHQVEEAVKKMQQVSGPSGIGKSARGRMPFTIGFYRGQGGALSLGQCRMPHACHGRDGDAPSHATALYPLDSTASRISRGASTRARAATWMGAARRPPVRALLPPVNGVRQSVAGSTLMAGAA